MILLLSARRVPSGRSMYGTFRVRDRGGPVIGRAS
jgi:hypothetical protein